jgi:putative ATP-dependent endonuclease of the OLD family
MRVTRLRIENFRSIRDLDLCLDDTTVFIGANNTGKTAILEAVRIALSRRWGRRGTGFTEFDVHCRKEDSNPKTEPPVKVDLHFEEAPASPWDSDMVAALDDLVVLTESGRNLVSLRVTCEWDSESEAFEPAWEFLNAVGQPLTNKARRATNTSGFFEYAPLFYLAALRDAMDEFAPRSSLWTRLLKSIRIPGEVEGAVQESLESIDAQLLASDPKLKQIAQKISQAAKVAVGQSEGDARLRMLPMNMWDLISRTSVVLKNEDLRPWLPLDRHGQGLQSLSVIFLFQAAVFQQLEEEAPGTEPIFLLEEPEAHLHPQAARTLWEHITELPGQKLVTTHSPYFVQRVPLHNLRLVRHKDGQTEVSYLPRYIESDLPWNENVAQLAAHQGAMFSKDSKTGVVVASTWFDSEIGAKLIGCYKTAADQNQVGTSVQSLRHRCRGLITAQEEHELSFLGRRVRGEIFFARRWVLVEGQSEYVLLHAIGRALGYSLDRHGVAVIDFQNNGDADIYPALATSFDIPWLMITDGDDEASRFRKQILKRGFSDDDLTTRFLTLPPPNKLEDQLLADGHEQRLRDILAKATTDSALNCSLDEFRGRLRKQKIACISRLALQVETSEALALQMPKAFVDLVQAMKNGAQ